MATPGPTRYQKQLAARRKTSDITRLANQYQENIKAVTGEYETAFGQYQTQVAETLAPYEAAVKTYQEVTLPEYQNAANIYQQQAAKYQADVSAYNQLIQESYITNVSGQKSVFRYSPMTGTTWDVVNPENPLTLPGTADYASFSSTYKPVGSSVSFVQETRWPSRIYAPPEDYLFEQTGAGGNYVWGYLQTPVTTPPPEPISAQPPPAPEAPPQAPELAEFDTTAFTQRRAQVESEFKREVGERKGARLSAVSRKAARPLLQGG